MSIDLTTQSARSQRDSLASRTEVLDKVKALSLLPDDLHATTEQVSTYFEVDADTIRWHVRTSRDELDSDAYRVVTRSIFETEFGSLSNLDPKVRQIELFPRRAILRIAMLLRDSAVARRVRDHLLDVESLSREMGEDEIVLRALQIQGRKIEALTERVAELEPKAEYVDLFVTDSDVLSFSTVASTLDMQASKLRKLLIERGWIFKETATRWSNSKGCKEDVNRYSEYSHKKPYFRRLPEHDIPRFRGEVMHTLKFTPEG
ncbi:phage antirepressor KilAC domain-containing protein, partial [Frankia tisae]|uniref:phage antirepressor KilAC domain-containing protein n=1 Tax=Frankia tisae TaxID=2950104 RepID=UPI0021BE69B3